MVSKISQMMLQSTTEIRCISITRNWESFLQRFHCGFYIIKFLALKHFCCLFYEGIHFITGNTASIRQIKLSDPKDVQ